MNFDLIKLACQERGITMEALATKIGFSRSGFSTTLKKGSLKVGDLEKIAEELGVSPSYFFTTSEPLPPLDRRFNYFKEILTQSETFIEIGYTIASFLQENEEIKQPIIELILNKCTKGEKESILREFDSTYKEFDFEDEALPPLFVLNNLMVFIENYKKKKYQIASEDFESALLKSFQIFAYKSSTNEIIRFLLDEGLIYESEVIDNIVKAFNGFFKLIPKDFIKILYGYFDKSTVIDYERSFKRNERFN